MVLVEGGVEAETRKTSEKSPCPRDKGHSSIYTFYIHVVH